MEDPSKSTAAGTAKGKEKETEETKETGPQATQPEDAQETTSAEEVSADTEENAKSGEREGNLMERTDYPL